MNSRLPPRYTVPGGVPRRHHRRVPVVAIRRLAGRRTRIDAHRVAGHRIDQRQVAVARRRIDLAPVGLVDGLAGAVAEADLDPVLIEDAEPVARGARPHPRVVVLQPGVDPVRIAVVDGDPVDLRDRDVVHADVRLAHVEALVQAAVADDVDVARVRGIDAQHVMIGLQADVVGRRRRLLLERRAAVLALDDVDAGQPDALVVVRIDGRLAVVHRPRIGRAHPLPRRAGVLGAIRAAGRSRARWSR